MVDSSDELSVKEEMTEQEKVNEWLGCFFGNWHDQYGVLDWIPAFHTKGPDDRNETILDVCELDAKTIELLIDGLKNNGMVARNISSEPDRVTCLHIWSE